MQVTTHYTDEHVQHHHAGVKFHATFHPDHDGRQRNFGALVALDHVTIAPGENGFGMHRHSDLEIISLVRSGDFVHRDSKQKLVLAPGTMQVLTAGIGTNHGAYNNSSTQALTLLQMWICKRSRGPCSPRPTESKSRRGPTPQLGFAVRPPWAS